VPEAGEHRRRWLTTWGAPVKMMAPHREDGSGPSGAAALTHVEEGA
jgi:hypothetical protein